MAMSINEECINCEACLDECPSGAIVSNDKNPTGEDYFYIFADKCDECGGSPACVDVCPSDAIHKAS